VGARGFVLLSLTTRAQRAQRAQRAHERRVWKKVHHPSLLMPVFRRFVASEARTRGGENSHLRGFAKSPATAAASVLNHGRGSAADDVSSIMI